MLVTLILLTVLALGLSILLTLVTRVLALRWNLVDHPDNKRKIHKKPVPRIGGIPIALAYSGACVIGTLLLPHTGMAFDVGFAVTRSIAPAAALVFLVGLADDIFGLKPLHKLAVEILAACLVVAGGVTIHGVPPLAVHPLLAQLATVVWLVACTNAVNLIDGLDGLAAGIALLATGTILIASIVSGSYALTIATAPLMGALLGFLLFNFNPASIFLGDSGSLLLGFLLGCYAVTWSGKSATVVGMTAPLLALAVPLLDTSLAILRRFLRAQPIFGADRSHVHHRLLALGFSQRRAVLLLYTAAGLAGSLAIALFWARNHWEALILAIFAAGAAFGIRHLGYAEFETARRIIVQGGFRRELNAQLVVKSFEEALSQAITPADCWAVIQGASNELGLRPNRMQLGGRMFGKGYGSDGTRSSFAANPSQPWAIHIPLPESDWIELAPSAKPPGRVTAMEFFVDTMRRVLAEKTALSAAIDEGEEDFLPQFTAVASNVL